MVPTITKRNLSEQEINLFIDEIKKFPNPIIGHKERWKRLTCFYIGTIGKSSVGICGVLHKKNWVMLDPIIIRKQYHGKGHATAIIKSILNDYPKYKIFFGTRNPALWKIATNLGFEEYQIWKLPTIVKLYLLKFTLESLNIAFIRELIRKNSLQQGSFRFFLKYEII